MGGVQSAVAVCVALAARRHCSVQYTWALHLRQMMSTDVSGRRHPSHAVTSASTCSATANSVSPNVGSSHLTIMWASGHADE